MKTFQNDIVNQASLHKYKDIDKTKQIERLFKQFTSLQSDEEGLNAVDNLKRKLDHDIQQQVKDLMKLREFFSSKTGVKTDEAKYDSKITGL